ncbi:hypothetical protein CSKR_106027 [Clonorchis sinensis]|uniref:Uncharacterized protein n=1 Tax=Clonorchis sinensis TaxID=79923 RepID=A0A419PBW5_CLOSI|nr:hypothetical protein CSKR_106027 [Clonorchis sinensis]
MDDTRDYQREVPWLEVKHGFSISLIEENRTAFQKLGRNTDPFILNLRFTVSGSNKSMQSVLVALSFAIMMRITPTTAFEETIVPEVSKPLGGTSAPLCVSKAQMTKFGALKQACKIPQPKKGRTMLNAHQGAVRARTVKTRTSGTKCPSYWCEIQWQESTLNAMEYPAVNSALTNVCVLCIYGARWPRWLEREFTDRKVPTSASRLPLSRLGQPGSIPALVQPSGGMAVRHRKGATAEQLNTQIDCTDRFNDLLYAAGEEVKQKFIIL